MSHILTKHRLQPAERVEKTNGKTRKPKNKERGNRRALGLHREQPLGVKQHPTIKAGDRRNVT